MTDRADDPDRRSEGPWAQAWKRLRKHRMAMAGLVFVVLTVVCSFAASWLVPFDPRTMERWTGALDPGHTHLDLRNEMVVTAGARPREQDLPRNVARTVGDGAAHVWTLEVLEEQVTTLRVTLEGAKITQIGEGAKRHVRLDLAPGERLRVKDGGAALATTALVTGETLPDSFAAEPGRNVVMIERVRRSPDARRTVEVRFAADGTAESVTSAGTAVAGELRLRAEDVEDATLDGVRQEHTHLLGTDQEGRDVLARVLHGGQVSLMVGLVATFVSLSIGVVYGAFAGFRGGRTDVVMMRIVDVLYALPYIFLVIIMLVAFGRSIYNLFIALGAVQWLTISRIVRGQVLSLKQREFVDAAVTLGTRPAGILFRHLIPNTLGIVVVFTTLTIPAVILEESFLSFIGLTVMRDGEPIDSWGALVDYGRNALGSNGERWWLLLCPAAAMSLTLFSMNFLGDGLRDALDPRQKGRG